MVLRLLICSCLCLFLLIGSECSVTAQDRETKIQLADSILNVRGEVYFSFNINDFDQQIHKFISVDYFRDSLVYAYSNEKGFQSFLLQHIDFQLQPDNFFPTKLKHTAYASVDSIYPSYPKYLQTMQAFAQQYSTQCQLLEAGLSVKGRKLLMLKISSPVNQANTRPKVLLSSSIHGNELTGFKLLLWLSEYLLMNYGKDMLVTRLTDECEIWINPLTNPDGAYFGGDHTVLKAKRFNANNLDLNRNFPDPAEGDHPDKAVWQPETKALMAFYEKNRINLSVSLHTGEEVVNYPWDTWSRLHADDTWYRYISRQYADSARNASNNTYMFSSKENFDKGIVQGYNWYRITGGKQDYVNYFNGGREVTLELSANDLPDSTSLIQYWNYNRISMLRFIEQSLFGIKGVVTDAEDNTFIGAKVEVLAHDKDNAHVYSNKATGTFFRYLYSGEYMLQFSAPGYEPVIKENVIVNNGFRTEVEVKMLKSNKLGVFPNPFNNEINIAWGNSEFHKHPFHFNLVNITGKTVFEGSVSSSAYPARILLPHLPQGLYLLEIRSPELVKSFLLLKQ